MLLTSLARNLCTNDSWSRNNPAYGLYYEIHRHLSFSIHPKFVPQRVLDDEIASCCEWFWLQHIDWFYGLMHVLLDRNYLYQSLPKSHTDSKYDREWPELEREKKNKQQRLSKINLLEHANGCVPYCSFHFHRHSRNWVEYQALHLSLLTLSPNTRFLDTFQSPASRSRLIGFRTV